MTLHGAYTTMMFAHEFCPGSKLTAVDSTTRFMLVLLVMPAGSRAPAIGIWEIFDWFGGAALLADIKLRIGTQTSLPAGASECEVLGTENQQRY